MGTENRGHDWDIRIVVNEDADGNPIHRVILQRISQANLMGKILYLPDNVTDIADEAACTGKRWDPGIDLIEFPKSILHIGKESFANTGLRHLRIEESSGVLHIGNSAFSSNPIEDIEIRTKFTLGKSAFMDMSICNMVNFDNLVGELPDYAFYSARHLKYLSLSKETTKISETALSDTNIRALILNSRLELSYELVMELQYVRSDGGYGEHIKDRNGRDIQEWVSKDLDIFVHREDYDYYQEQLRRFPGATDVRLHALHDVPVVYCTDGIGVGTYPYSRTEKFDVVIDNGKFYKREHDEQGDDEEMGVNEKDRNQFMYHTKVIIDRYRPVDYDPKGDTVYLPENTMAIARGAFNCTNPIHIIMNDGLERIEDSGIRNCGVTELNVPASVEYIGKYAFAENTFLKKLTIAARVELQKGICYNCTNLAEVDAPEIHGKIPDYAFANCENLESITLYTGVTEISDLAFTGCPKLSKLILYGKITLPKNGIVGFPDKNIVIYTHNINMPFYIHELANMECGISTEKTGIVVRPISRLCE